MTEALVIRDCRTGITHRFEAAARHNTRCGQMAFVGDAQGATPIGGSQVGSLSQGTIDCMACMAGKSHLRMIDLHLGVEIRVRVQFYDRRGAPVGSAKPITFTRGHNIDEVQLDDFPIGIGVHSYGYLNDDGDLISSNKIGVRFSDVFRRSEGDRIVIQIGQAVVE